MRVLSQKKLPIFLNIRRCGSALATKPAVSGFPAGRTETRKALRELRLQGVTKYRPHRFLAAARELALLEANRLDIQSAPVAATPAEEPLGERPGLNIYTRSKDCFTDNEISEDERARLIKRKRGLSGFTRDPESAGKNI